MPTVEEMVHINSFDSKFADYDLVFVAYELESSRSLKKHLEGEYKKIAILIGPEGGFETTEIDALVNLGVHSVSLGPRILRTETAGMTMLSIIQYELGDISES